MGSGTVEDKQTTGMCNSVLRGICFVNCIPFITDYSVMKNRADCSVMKMKCLYEGSTWRPLSQYSFSKLKLEVSKVAETLYSCRKNLTTAYLFTTSMFPKRSFFDIARFLATSSEHLTPVNVISHLREQNSMSGHLTKYLFHITLLYLTGTVHNHSLLSIK